MQKLNKIINEFSVISPEVSYFKLVYEQKSINGAARKIGQDPGNISRLVSRLEKSIGAALFVRHKTGLHPTELGDRFFQALNNAQWEFTQTLRANSIGSSPLRVGFSPTIAHSHFSESIVSQILALGMAPEFFFGPSVELVDRIKKRELDFVIIPNRLKFPGLVMKGLGSEHLALCSSTGLAQNNFLMNPELLGAERLIQSISYSDRWMMKDYFVIANMLSQNPQFMGILPEGLLKTYRNLNIIRRFHNEGKITALSWPGSIGMELMKVVGKN